MIMILMLTPIECNTWGILEHCPEALFTKLFTIIVDETDGVANTVDVVDIIDDRGGRDISMTSSKLSWLSVLSLSSACSIFSTNKKVLYCTIKTT